MPMSISALKALRELIAARTATAATAPEQKMLQGMYRGYAGDYDAAKAAQDAGLVYVTPQRAAAETYAKNRVKQAARRGEAAEPHVEMVLVDPASGRRYGHSTLGTGEQGPIRTLAAELQPEDVVSTTQLYADGGEVSAPFIGYRSAGRRPESQQDREASANAPLSALRGWLAGTLGLPGDIEGLLRMLTPGVSNETALPGSEYFREKLPLKSLQESPTGRAFQELGGVTGGAGLGTTTRMAGSGAKALGRATAEQVAKAVEAGNPLTAAFAPMHVVKPKGGNWLAGAGSERVTAPVKSIIHEYAPGAYGYESADLVPHNVNARTMNEWIDKKLGNYVKNEMGTPEDPLRAMAEKWSTEKPQRLAEADAKLETLNAKTRELAGQRGIPEEWLTSHRRDVLSAEKARDLIAAREALHTQGVAHGGGRWVPENLESTRRQAGFPAEGMGVSEPAKVWEQLADESIRVDSAGTHLKRPVAPQLVASNPWLAKVPPETPIYGTHPSNELGFEHLVDELNNALDPNSGLPAEFMLKYSDLPKKTLPDVVNRVADINAWRAAQKAEADLAKANNAAMVPFKEYPEQGLAWKEFKTPEVKSVDELGPEQKSWYDDYVAGGVSPEGALKRVGGMGEGKNILRDALQYEGDTLQHCVGGANYCEAVQAGESKIYSLRDERGKPHATIQVKMPEISRDIRDYPGLSEDEYKMLRQENSGSNATRSPMKDYLETHLGSKRAQEVLSSYAEVDPLPIIAQIKGLRNGPPEAKYLPQIQDFIKSGNWSEVNDLNHSGLQNISTQLTTPQIQYLQKAGVEVPTWGTVDENKAIYDDLVSRFRAEGVVKPEGFAAGGYVEYDPARVDQVMQQTRAGFAAGGLVNDSISGYNPARVDEIVNSLRTELFQ